MSMYTVSSNMMPADAFRQCYADIEDDQDDQEDKDSPLKALQARFRAEADLEEDASCACRRA